MEIEKVFGLQCTGIGLSDRFTMLASVIPERFIQAKIPQKRMNISSFLSQNFNFNNQNIIQQIARKLQQQTKRRALQQRLGINPPMGRYGSESNLPLRRSNSFSNLNQRQNIKKRLAWQQSNNNLSRSASFSNLSEAVGRDFRRRGGKVGAQRGKLRGVRWQFGNSFGREQNTMPARTQNLHRRMRGGRGGIMRKQANGNPVPTKEELDAQLDQYMASTKLALDKELDAYMKNSLEIE